VIRHLARRGVNYSIPRLSIMVRSPLPFRHDAIDRTSNDAKLSTQVSFRYRLRGFELEAVR
jgi:hypothetical protein